MSIDVSPLRAADRERWDVLARGYKTFYETVLPDAAYDRAWERLLANDRVYGLGATADGRLIGITHYLFHTSTWADRVCYLQDLFVDPAARGLGAGRALIEAVAKDATARGASTLYWVTHEQNATARALYDRVARYEGFVRYDYAL